MIALVHLDAIYRAALRLSRDAAEAEDLAQEVFLRAYRAFDQFERGTNCRAWLFKIVKNAFINRERSMG
ncbi:MAG: sigma-70 family RNA polymerase sigma factor, partial [bacterium]